MVSLKAIGLVSTLALLPLTALGHHGVSGQFDRNQRFDVSGVITRIRLVNPHAYVYFDVTDESGSEVNMRCELLPGSTLKRKGWTREMFAVGSRISVNGSPDRNDPTTCYLNQITFENGVTANRDSVFTNDGTVEIETRQLLRADGTPNIAGNWAMIGRQDRRSPPPKVTLTPAGAAAVADASPDQNPRFNCEPTNIIMDWWFNENVNVIEQSSTDITMTYGFMDLERTIHLDANEMPADFTPSRTGFSIGAWEGNTLVVRTTGFDEGWIMAPLGPQRGRGPEGLDETDGQARHPERPVRSDGESRREHPSGRRRGPEPLKNSADLVVVERFSLNKAGNLLKREFVLTDARYFEGTIEGADEVTLTSDPYEPYNCEDLTNERTQ